MLIVEFDAYLHLDDGGLHQVDGLHPVTARVCRRLLELAKRGVKVEEVRD